MSEQTTVREGIAKQIMLSYFPELRNDQPKNMIKVYGRDHCTESDRERLAEQLTYLLQILKIIEGY